MIIGLCGFIGAGKDTVADILVNNYVYKKLAVADTLKDTVSVMFDWPRELLQGDTEASRAFRDKRDEFWSTRLGFDVTPRSVLQDFGTRIVRENLHSEFWIHSLERKMGHHTNMVISDVRFSNEAKAIKDAGGHLVRIKRGVEPVWYETAKTKPYDMEKLYPNVHLSEWSWVNLKFDYVLENSLKFDLPNQVELMLWSLCGKQA